MYQEHKLEQIKIAFAGLRVLGKGIYIISVQFQYAL